MGGVCVSIRGCPITTAFILKPLGTSLLNNLIIATDCLVNLTIILLKLTINLGIMYFLNTLFKRVINSLIFLKSSV